MRPSLRLFKSPTLKTKMNTLLSASPPPMGSTLEPGGALATSSSSYYSHGSSLFDKVLPTSNSFSEGGTPLMTPVGSEGTLEEKDGDGNSKDKGKGKMEPTVDLFDSEDMDTTFMEEQALRIPESTSMPLIHLAPEDSVDISSITPETMQLVTLLMELGSTLDAATLLNNIVNAKKRKAALEKEFGLSATIADPAHGTQTQELGPEPPFAQVAPSTIFEPTPEKPAVCKDAALAELLTPKRAHDSPPSSFSLTPPAAPRLRPMALRSVEDIPDLSLDDLRTPEKKNHGSQGIIYNQHQSPSGMRAMEGSSIYQAATPGSMLFGSYFQSEPVSKQMMMPSSPFGMGEIHGVAPVSKPRSIYADPDEPPFDFTIDVSSPELYQDMFNRLKESPSLLQMALIMQGGSEGVAQQADFSPKASFGASHSSIVVDAGHIPLAVAGGSGTVHLDDIASVIAEHITLSSSVGIPATLDGGAESQIVQSTSIFSLGPQTPGGPMSPSSNFFGTPSRTPFGLSTPIEPSFDRLAREIRVLLSETQARKAATPGNLTAELDAMIKDSQAGIASPAVDLLARLKSASPFKLGLAPFSLPPLFNSPFRLARPKALETVVEEPSLLSASPSPPSRNKSAPTLPTRREDFDDEDVDRPARSLSVREDLFNRFRGPGVAARLFPEAHALRRGVARDNGPVGDDPFLMSPPPIASRPRPSRIPVRAKAVAPRNNAVAAAPAVSDFAVSISAIDYAPLSPSPKSRGIGRLVPRRRHSDPETASKSASPSPTASKETAKDVSHSSVVVAANPVREPARAAPRHRGVSAPATNGAPGPTLRTGSQLRVKPRARSTSPPASLPPIPSKSVLRPRARPILPPPDKHCPRAAAARSSDSAPSALAPKARPSWMFAPRVGEPRQRTSSSSSRASSRSSRSTVEAGNTSDDAASGSESESSNEDLRVPRGMDPGAWDAALALVPRRSNRPNPLAPNGVFGVETGVLVAAAQRHLGLASSPPAVPEAPVLDSSVAPAAIDQPLSPPDGSVESDWSSQWLSPDAYDALEAARGVQVSPSVSVESFESEYSTDSWISINIHEARHAALREMSDDQSSYRSAGRDSAVSDDDSSSSMSFGPLTPSNSAVNLAGIGIGKGLPSHIPYASRSREGPPSSSSGFTLSSTHSLNTFGSTFQPRIRVLHTIIEEPPSPQSSPGKPSPPRPKPTRTPQRFKLKLPFPRSAPSASSSTGTGDHPLTKRKKVASALKSVVNRVGSALPPPRLWGKAFSRGGVSPSLVVHEDVEQVLDLSDGMQRGRRAGGRTGRNPFRLSRLF